MSRTMTTVALPRPVPPHRSSSGIVALSPIALETISTQQVSSTAPAPLPNKHIPVCPTGPAPAHIREPTTTPPSPPPPSRHHSDEGRRQSLLHPPDRFERLENGSVGVFKITAADLAGAIDYLSRQPLPDPSHVFPWFHGMHPNNHIQQTFFMSRSNGMKQFPGCLRGITVVKADSDLTVARLKGAVAPHEFLLPGAVGEFVEADPREGFSVRNFQIQTAKTATTSDVVIYGEDAGLVRKLGWEVAAAQAKWRRKLEAARQLATVPQYNTFVCVAPFAEFEERHPEIVAVNARGQLTGAVVDLFHQERLEMYSLTRATEISHNVWLGPTPEPDSPEEEGYDVLIECSDLGRLNPSALRAIAEGPANSTKKSTPAYLDFPSSGSIMPPTWSHAEADGILDTCKWMWHLSQGTLPPRPCLDDMTDEDGDSYMSDGSSSSCSTSADDEGNSGEEQATKPRRRQRWYPRRPERRILIHCADGYTESTVLAIAYFSYSTGRTVAAAWMDLHTELKRNFFAYPTDVGLLTSIAVRLLHESPVCFRPDATDEKIAPNNHVANHDGGDDRKIKPRKRRPRMSLSEVTALVRQEPRWLASLDGSFPSRILDYMYLGNLGHANNPELLKALGIRQILSVGETAMWRDGELEEWGVDNVHVVEKVQDNGIDPLTKEFERCLKFIERGRRNGTATLVHCRVGVSRSATICIAEVMRAMELSFPRAYCFVRARRLNVIIQPHLRFAYELLKWEETLQGRRHHRQHKHQHTRQQRSRARNTAVEDTHAQHEGGGGSGGGRTGGGTGFRRELEWGEIAREIALMNKPYAR
ncbi:hypothetical protein GGS23DRAFT_485261 [Durotheca rogersii]|uniref:uncharacterized protein n=1 Tax=Durotheca rogersii TaxID=419775 RepID=UPI00221E637D|nr:uncharacterized protein GGS23DRAFT_485261 [Durotheca rogersii]KAI5864159.1 hypothetical protein GGS23DRAFT_485261 [Durotheca rogersii]